jgi:hypothetical protein
MLSLSAMPFSSKKFRRCAGLAPDPTSLTMTIVKNYAHRFKRVKA